MGIKTDFLNLEDRAVIAWMALYSMLWKFGVAPQFYETSRGLRMLTKLQNRIDNEDRGI